MITNNTICLLPGDGIGLEVIPIAETIIDVLDIELSTKTYPIGWECFQNTGKALPQNTFDAISKTGIALFGATSSPKEFVKGYTSPIIDLRQKLDLYANLRPSKSLPIPSSMPNIDLVVVRENTEGLYIRKEYWKNKTTAIAERQISFHKCEQTAKIAAKLAKQRKGHLTIGHKSNVLSLSDGFFLETVTNTVKNYAPEIIINDQLIDSLAHDLIIKPDTYDVIVTPNMYGDIISDVTSALTGGLGIAPSANIGDQCVIYEPVHGSAPNISGKNIANPTATILSISMMFKDLGLHSAANQLDKALYSTLQEGIGTPDIGGNSTTSKMIDAIMEKLKH
tara:strand:- start:185 stop:1195 length:1011 start_codon:yes stop_codon:yes gene_type:complete